MDPLLVRLDREPEPGFKPCNLVIILEACLPQLWTILRLCAWYLRWSRHVGVPISAHGSKRPHTVAHELICLGKRANLKSRGWPAQACTLHWRHLSLHFGCSMATAAASPTGAA